MKLLSVEALKEGMILERDVYVEGVGEIPILRKDTVLKDYMIKALGNYQVPHVLVVTPEDSLWQDLPPYEPPVLDMELREQALGNLQGLFTEVGQGRHNPGMLPDLVQQMNAVVHHLVGSVEDEQSAPVNITDLKSFDEYTYHHSLSVAVLSIAIGYELGLKADALTTLGQCAILHDIGKMAIPLPVLNKKGRLTPSEFELIKTHSHEGFLYLQENNIGDEEIWQTVLLHHERYDGEGYPYGCKNEEIPLYSRIISVADVYDALTSNRPYRQPLPPADALEYVMANAGGAFDYDIVTALVGKLELYPVGSLLELSDGSKAVVLDNQNTMRPLVRLLDTGEVLDLYWDRRYLNLTIKRLLQSHLLFGGGQQQTQMQ